LWVLRISLTEERLPFGCCPSKRSKQNPQLERERERERESCQIGGGGENPYIHLGDDE
jgi:hypothetical protein